MLPTIDIHSISHELVRLGDEVQRACDDRPGVLDPGPRFLLDGLTALLNTLSDADDATLTHSLHTLRRTTGSAPDTLLAHGLHLLEQLADQAHGLGLVDAAAGLESLSLPLTCWMLRRGAELDRPELVVKAAGNLARGLRDPDELATLCALMTELVDGISPAISQEPGSLPHRPWRVLLLERADVAMRTQRPALMRDAFEALCEHLPQDAPDVFREGLGQLQALGASPVAREVMQSYYDRWCSGQRLH